ncbi:MAG: helix-turn-helix transcriptional regulator [Mogibacterium sp.]|nr:helix-turn-helix transcriptional regulator [Mogibacterium sp.]
MKTVHSAADIGKAIRVRRKELGYTQAFLAEYAGVSASFLSELENGKETVQINKLMDVMSLLGMDLCIYRRGE